jgi:hypothetical protein
LNFLSTTGGFCRILPAIWLVAGAAFGAETGLVDKKPVPAPSAQAEAEKTIRDLFKADYAKRAPADRAALAGTLIQVGIETADDPASRYVLFREAAALASDAGAVALVLKAVEETARFYTVDGLALKAEALTGLDADRLKPEGRRELAAALGGVLDDAMASERVELAVRLAGALEGAARRSGDPQLVRQAEAKVKAARELEKVFAEVKPALKALAERPGDPDACLAVGRFYCFGRGDWERGLPLLAKGRDAALKGLAEKDLGSPEEAMERYAVGNGWWEWGEKEKLSVLEKTRVLQRTAQWFELALPGLSGLYKTAAERRLEAVRAALEAAGGAMAPAVLLRNRQPAVIYANCDNKFILCVNGKEALKGDDDTVAKTETSLRAGDVLTVRGENISEGAGFACAIVFPGLKQAFVSNLRGWRCYTPRVPAQWAAPAGIDKVRPAEIGTNQHWRDAVCKSSGFSCVALWDEESAMTAYLTLKVSDEYLVSAALPGAGAALPAGSPPGAQWALIQAVGDESFLLAVNGEIVLYGKGDEVWTVPIPMRMGDCITVRGVNRGGHGGFCCAVAFPARKKAAVTDVRRWRLYTPRDAKTWYVTGSVGAEKPPVAVAEHPWKGTLKSKTGLNGEMLWGPDSVSTCYLCFRLAEDAFVPMVRDEKPDDRGRKGDAGRGN